MLIVFGYNKSCYYMYIYIDLFQSCLDGFDCVQITCLVKNLVKHDQEVINITLDVHEKSLAKTKVKAM